MKYITILIIISLIVTILPTPNAQQDWVIQDDTVYVDNPLLYASATPHTLSGSGWVEFQFNSKQYSGDIDMIWGFSDDTKPSKPQIYTSYSHTLKGTHSVEHYRTMTFYNITSFNNIGIENYGQHDINWGTPNNNFLFSFTSTDYCCPMIIAFSNYSINGNTYTISLNINETETYYYESYYPDWKPIDLEFEKINHNYQGMNTWYLLKNQPITSDKLYTIRSYINIPFNPNGTSGKYWWAFKPSSETLQESISSGHLYYLDPWYDTNWNYMKDIIIESDYIETTLSGFPILFHNTSLDFQHAQTDGDDFIFVADDNTTVYPHEIEYFNYTTGELAAWVNITTLSHSSDTHLMIYYGNDGCANQQQIPETWNSGYVGVYHFTNSTTVANDATSNGNTGIQVHSPVLNTTGRIAGGLWTNCTGSNTNTIKIPDDASLDFTTAMTIEWFHYDTHSAAEQAYQRILCKPNVSSTTGEFFIMTIDTSSDIMRYGSYSGGYRSQLWTTPTTQNSWEYRAAVCDYTTVDLYRNNTHEVSAGYNYALVPTGSPIYFAEGYENEENACVATVNFHGYFDEARFSNVVRNESWINASFYSVNASDFLTISAENEAPLPPHGDPEINSMSPANNSINVCPCRDYFCINISQNTSQNMNITVYANSTYNSTYTIILNISGVSNGTHCFCMIDPIYIFNTTYHWYVNITFADNSSRYNQSEIYQFNTTSPSNCIAVDTITDETWVLPVSVIFAIGYFMIMNKRRK